MIGSGKAYKTSDFQSGTITHYVITVLSRRIFAGGDRPHVIDYLLSRAESQIITSKACRPPRPVLW